MATTSPAERNAVQMRRTVMHALENLLHMTYYPEQCGVEVTEANQKTIEQMRAWLNAKVVPLITDGLLGRNAEHYAEEPLVFSTDWLDEMEDMNPGPFGGMAPIAKVATR